MRGILINAWKLPKKYFCLEKSTTLLNFFSLIELSSLYLLNAYLLKILHLIWQIQSSYDTIQTEI